MHFRKPLPDQESDLYRYFELDIHEIISRIDPVKSFKTKAEILVEITRFFFPKSDKDTPMVDVTKLPDVLLRELHSDAAVDYFLEIQRGLCDEADLCMHLQRLEKMENVDLAVLINDLIIKYCPSVAYIKSPLLTAVLITKLGVSRFCACHRAK